MPRGIVIDERFQGFSDTALGGYVAGPACCGVLRAARDQPAWDRAHGPSPWGRAAVTGLGRPQRGRNHTRGRRSRRAGGCRSRRRWPSRKRRRRPERTRGSTSTSSGLFLLWSGQGIRRRTADLPRTGPGRDRLVAAPWIPDSSLAGDDGRVRPEFVWAALDCPQLWSLIVGSPQDSTERVVTAAMATRIDGAVMPGRPHVVMAWPMDRVGWSLFAGGAVATTHGEVIAVSRQRAVALADRGVPLGLDLWHSRAR
jgi:hypothetical protein